MDIDKKIEDLRKEFNEKIDKLKKEYKKEKSSKWIPGKEKLYYYVMERLDIDSYIYHGSRKDKNIIKYSRIFETYDEAEEYAAYLKARKEYSYEFSKEEWENESICKYYIYYDFYNNNFLVSWDRNLRRVGVIYFKAEAQAREFLNKYKKQILKFEFDIEEE